jgi:hypothetical protein
MGRGIGLIQPQLLTGVTGIIVGPQIAPYEVTLNGWALGNSDSAGHNVKFYVPLPGVLGTGKPAAPSASGTLLFEIVCGATPASKEFLTDRGVYFKDGLFAVCDNADLTGCLFWS